MKLSGRKICPKGPDRTESMVPGSRSTNTARGTYLPPEICIVIKKSLLIYRLIAEKIHSHNAVTPQHDAQSVDGI